MMDKYLPLADDFRTFLKVSPSPFHAVQEMEERLRNSGFILLTEQDSWQLEGGGAYYVKRHDSALCAFRLCPSEFDHKGINIVGAHTDSPCLKVKPSPEITYQGYLSLGVEIYGSPILTTWFDRDLALAGKVSYIDKQGELKTELIDTKRAVAIIPNLAIHLTAKRNKGRDIDRQNELSPIILQEEHNGEKKSSFIELMKRELDSPEECAEIIAYDLSFYDHNPALLVGYNSEFLASARIDNLLSCFTGLHALQEADGEKTSILICNDHEEVGSRSPEGAAGPFLEDILYRICGSRENMSRSLSTSMLVSADNAHGVHPNYSKKHDDNHLPILNQGPVIKTNGNLKYATSLESSSVFQFICKQNKIAYQKFVARNDLPCGSTIGPITAARLGISTVDIGIPTFAMHSIRELCGTKDILNTYNALKAFYEYNIS
jgi:aspartyl aminopeptidase